MAVYQKKDKNGKPIKTKDGRSWYFRVYKNSKQFNSEYYLTKKQAEDEEALFKLKRDLPQNKSFNLISKDFFNEMYKKRKESTVYCYENIFKKNILPYFNKKSINSINIQMIKDWHDFIDKKPLKRSYKNKLYTVLNSIFKFAQKNYGLDKNFVEIVGGFEGTNEEIVYDKDKIRYMPYDDFLKLINVSDNITYKTLFIFLYYTGMRQGEIQALTWNDIDFKNKEIIVNKTLTTKTSYTYKITSTKNCKNRIIKMSKFLLDTLIEYKNEMMKFEDFSINWFVFGCSRFIPETTIRRYKEKYFNLANINKITIHEFRHSHVTLLANEYIKACNERKVEIDTKRFFIMLSNRMGHTVDVMEKTYMHLFPTVQNEIIDLLDNI